MTEQKTCNYCGTTLTRGEHEKTGNWLSRVYCNKKCAKSREHELRRTHKTELYGIKNLDSMANQPDTCHTLHVGDPETLELPLHRTEDEIDRLHQYNRMMGRGGY